MPDTQLMIRTVGVRAAGDAGDDAGAREFTGIAVPWDDPIRVRDWFGAYTEQVQRGAVEDSDDALVFWRHDEPIGRITAARDTDAGWEITGVLSATPRGEEAYTLLRDGVIDRMSIGFYPIEHLESEDETGTRHITHTRIQVREVSLVPFPAYDGAQVQSVRSATPKEIPTMPEATATDVEARAGLDDLAREVALLRAAGPADAPAPLQFRSAGALLQAIVRRDDAAISEYNEVQERAYTGATTADSVLKDSWVGDLTRLVEEAAPLASLFSTDALPATGLSIEYAQLQSDSTIVDEQVAEGDDLDYGEVAIETKTATVKTYGGYTELTRQAIERSSINYLNHVLRALALAAGRRRNTTLRTYLAAQRAAQVTANNTVSVTDGDAFTAWVSAIIDAAGKYEDLGLPMGPMVTDKVIFKRLAGLVDSAGRPLMDVTGTGSNAVGHVRPSALTADLAGVTVRLDAKQAATGATFTNPLAIRSYNSPVVSLQDDNVINLSRDFSLYYYSALASEIPAAIVPVTVTA